MKKRQFVILAASTLALAGAVLPQTSIAQAAGEQLQQQTQEQLQQQTQDLRVARAGGPQERRPATGVTVARVGVFLEQHRERLFVEDRVLGVPWSIEREAHDHRR